MTDKEIFLKIKTHLLSQGKKCLATYISNFRDFAYRSPEGLKCAVGCIISDEYYSPKLEGNNIGSIDVETAVAKSLGLSGEKLPRTLFHMLVALQIIHDSTQVGKWEESLARFRFTPEGSYLGTL